MHQPNIYQTCSNTVELLHELQDKLSNDIKHLNYSNSQYNRRGLINTHNTCFANSVVQSLYCIPLFNQLLQYLVHLNVNDNSALLNDCINTVLLYNGKVQPATVNNNINTTSHTHSQTSDTTVHNDVIQPNDTDQQLAEQLQAELNVDETDNSVHQDTTDQNTNGSVNTTDINTIAQPDRVAIDNGHNDDTSNTNIHTNTTETTTASTEVQRHTTTDSVEPAKLSSAQKRRLRQHRAKQGVVTTITQPVKQLSTIERIKAENAARRKASHQTTRTVQTPSNVTHTTKSNGASITNDNTEYTIEVSASVTPINTTTTPVSNTTGINGNASDPIFIAETVSTDAADDGFQPVQSKKSKAKQHKSNIKQLPAHSRTSSNASIAATAKSTSRPVTPVPTAQPTVRANVPSNNTSQPIRTAWQTLPTVTSTYKPSHAFVPPVQQTLNQFWSLRKSIPHTQQDSHEFLHYILDELHTELLNLTNNNRNNGLQQNNRRNSTDITDEWQEIGKKNKVFNVASSLQFQTTLISLLFNGRMRSALSSRLSTASVNIQPFYSLSLDIALPNIYTLNDAIDHYMSSTTIEGYRTAQHATSKLNQSTAVQKYSIDVLPNILILHLKRFDVVAQDDIAHDQYYAAKLSKHTKFDSTLSIPIKYVSGFNASKQSNTYTLCSFIVHHGNDVSSGHYTSYIRDLYAEQNGNERYWYHADDDIITRVSPSQVYNQPAYILMYQKK